MGLRRKGSDASAGVADADPEFDMNTVGLQPEPARRGKGPIPPTAGDLSSVSVAILPGVPLPSWVSPPPAAQAQVADDQVDPTAATPTGDLVAAPPAAGIPNIADPGEAQPAVALVGPPAGASFPEPPPGLVPAAPRPDLPAPDPSGWSPHPGGPVAWGDPTAPAVTDDTDRSPAPPPPPGVAPEPEAVPVPAAEPPAAPAWFADAPGAAVPAALSAGVTAPPPATPPVRVPEAPATGPLPPAAPPTSAPVALSAPPATDPVPAPAAAPLGLSTLPPPTGQPTPTSEAPASAVPATIAPTTAPPVTAPLADALAVPPQGPPVDWTEPAPAAAAPADTEPDGTEATPGKRSALRWILIVGGILIAIAAAAYAAFVTPGFLAGPPAADTPPAISAPAAAGGLTKAPQPADPPTGTFQAMAAATSAQAGSQYATYTGDGATATVWVSPTFGGSPVSLAQAYAAAGGAKLGPLTTVAAGPRGGSMQCGAVSAKQSVCFWTADGVRGAADVTGLGRTAAGELVAKMRVALESPASN